MNVNSTKNCFGCGVCSAACPKHIISIELNDDGFYEPRISHLDQCVDCGICYDVCAFNHNNCALRGRNIKSWAAWSNDEDTRKKCSSGGIGLEIGKQLLKQGYHVVGCRYDTKKQRAEHFIATSVEELTLTIGSKYIQSYTEEAFRQINYKREKYLVVGTPCQIDSFHRMVQKFRCEDNFLLMDFFCHSVPSMLGWKYYVSLLPKEIGTIESVSWRNKEQGGWHNSYAIHVKGESGEYISDRAGGDLFYKFFLDDLCVGPQCVKNCKYKYDHSSADIRIGDFWGKTYRQDQKGVSAIIAFTGKGCNVVENLDNVTLIEHSFEIVTEGQRKTNAKANPLRSVILKQLRNDGCISPFVLSLSGTISTALRRIRALSDPSFIRNKLTKHL